MIDTSERAEKIVTEVWRRLAATDGIRTTQRNPENPPEADDMPAGLLFELEDIPDSPPGQRNGYPAYKRSFSLAVEIFVKGSSAAAASKECRAFVQKVRAAIYAEPFDLGGLGRIEEKGNTQIISYDAANHIKAMGIGFRVRYGENLADLYS